MITQLVFATLLFSQTPSWSPLFSGNTLDGWTIVNGDASTWSVDDAILTTTGKPTGVIRTNKMYENFVLELDWRHMVENGNAGLFVWSDPIPAIGVPFTRSIEVQIMDGKELDWYTTHGDIFSIWGAKMTPDRPHPHGEHVQRCLPSERRSNPAPEWNHYIVTCIDGQIHLSVNGAFVAGAHDVRPRRGYICLEAEGTEAEFKNIRIMELPPAAPVLVEEFIANDDQGQTTLFTGISLEGWRTSQPARWTSVDNVLECHDESDTLTTLKSYTSYELMFDYKCNSEQSSVYVVIDGKKTELACTDNEEWIRFRVDGDSGTIGIGGKNAAFTNLFIRPRK